MIKVKVIEEFTLGKNPEYKFEDLKNIVRAGREEKGRLFENDTFECDKKMADYLLRANELERAFVKVIEVMPKKEIQKAIDKPVKKETKSRKTIAKK